jgi:hypothetical protein
MTIFNRLFSYLQVTMAGLPAMVSVMHIERKREGEQGGEAAKENEKIIYFQ